ncbi:MAG: hypothetical protein AAB624_01710 [Patescibacteria group bacterium]
MKIDKLSTSFSAYRWLGMVLSLAFLAVFISNNVLAQSSDTASGLRLAPLRSELIIEPGKSDTVSVKLKNVSGGAVIINSVVVDFKSNEDGSPSALPQSDEQLPTSIRSYLTPTDGVELAADAEYDYKLPLEVPQDTSPGAYYGLVLFQAVPVDQEEGGVGKVALTASIGHVVLLEVPGDVIEQLQVLSVKAARQTQPDAAKAPIVRPGSLFSSAPNQVQIDVKNTGNSFLKPFGNVSISDWRGNLVSTAEINTGDPKGNVLPDANRVFVVPVTEVKGIGRFTILTNIGYGNGNEVVTVKSTFWVLPLWFVALVATLVALLIFGILRLVKKIRR